MQIQNAKAISQLTYAYGVYIYKYTYSEPIPIPIPFLTPVAFDKFDAFCLLRLRNNLLW